MLKGTLLEASLFLPLHLHYEMSRRSRALCAAFSRDPELVVARLETLKRERCHVKYASCLIRVGQHPGCLSYYLAALKEFNFHADLCGSPLRHISVEMHEQVLIL